MKKTVLAVFAAACSLPAAAVFTVSPGCGRTQLYSTEGTFTTSGGLALDSGRLYFGQADQVQSLDLSDNSLSTVGTLESNTGNSFVVRHAGTTWTSYTLGYFPNDTGKMGYLDASGTYHNQLSMKGIWDAAVSPLGQCYLVANPGSGTGIYRYDWQSGLASLVADIGGYSGGLAFDSLGRLYYADQASGDILRYSADQLQAGNLTDDDGQSVLHGLFAGFIGFDENDVFYATTGYGNLFSSYNVATGGKLADIASSDSYGIGKFAAANGMIYVIDTDWAGFYSTVQAIYPMPEPATLLLLSAGLLLAKRKK